MKGLPTTIAVSIEKGGSGKTTTAINLAAALAERGFKVLLIDMDPQGNATMLLGVGTIGMSHAAQSVYQALTTPGFDLCDIIVPTRVPNLDIAPGNEAMKGLDGALPQEMGRELTLREQLDAMYAQGKRYDFVVIDTPPTSGINVNLALCAADRVLIPLQSEELPVTGVVKMRKTIDQARRFFNPELEEHIVITMADAQLSHTRPIEEETRARYGSLVYQTVIPEQVEMKRPVSGGGPVVLYAPKSAGAVAYQALTDEVLLG